MFSNKIVCGVHASRYIASWLRVGGRLEDTGDAIEFYRWLLALGLSEEDAKHIRRLAENGKLELENHAKQYLNSLK